MSHETIANTIRSRFKTLIADVESLTVQYDNQDFTPPDNIMWARCNIRFGESRQASTGSPGNNIFRVTGLLIAQIFQPLNLGDKAALELADSIADAFRAVTASGVVFKTPSVSNIGRDSAWWNVNVNCPFQADYLA